MKNFKLLLVLISLSFIVVSCKQNKEVEQQSNSKSVMRLVEDATLGYYN